MDTQLDLWEVFVQSKPGQPYKHAGSVHASDKGMALQNARDVYTRRGEASGLWVVRAADIVASNLSDNDMFFDPANDKIYRHPTFYKMPEGAQNI
ncbi:MAG: 1,2-phenylacetyl-CoA epoxidase subunit B [Thermoanaerobaculia bacterium]|nr:1,2-phenylacetyl-CoA epoxidase subunit B [Thermoanaerobaculia bacterium]